MNVATNFVRWLEVIDSVFSMRPYGSQTDGVSVNQPQFLYGTAWKEDSTQNCVSKALAAGFRGIDTANQRKHYFEAAVGAALKDFKIPRAELFLQTKFTFQHGQDHRLPFDPTTTISKQVQQSFESSLEHLFTDYLDSYILHGPMHFNVPNLVKEDWEAWRAMEDLHRQGRVQVIGISNVNLAQLKELCEGAKTLPRFVQNRCYARNAWDQEIRQYCKSKGITYQGFSLLTANKNALNSQKFIGLTKHLGKTSAQIVFAFARQVGMLPLTGTTNSDHMKEDLESLSLTLSDKDLDLVEYIATNE